CGLARGGDDVGLGDRPARETRWAMLEHHTVVRIDVIEIARLAAVRARGRHAPHDLLHRFGLTKVDHRVRFTRRLAEETHRPTPPETCPPRAPTRHAQSR